MSQQRAEGFEQTYPSLLADKGLGDALRAVARSGHPRPQLRLEGVGRYPPEVESAVYFCCLEALQNASKHAEAGSIRVSVTGSHGLRFEVHDDGRGFQDGTQPGTGLTNMHDRLAAVAHVGPGRV